MDEKRCSQNPMTIEYVVEFALRVIARELTEFCGRYAAKGIVLIQGEFVRRSPSENRKSEQQKEQTTERPKPSPFVASDGSPIVIC